MIELACSNLTIGYDGHMVAKDINFSINSGDYLCIVGENGSGKSTLMKTILGLKKQISGKTIFNPNIRLNEIGFVPQQIESQKDFPASVYEIVLSGCLGSMGLNPFYTNKQKEIAHKNMKTLGISSLCKKSYRELSSGQQQRVLLARGLCAAKKILFLDEPVTGLDPIITNELYELIKRLNKEEKMTIVMISHDIPSAIKYSSHILYISQTCFFGTNKEFIESDLSKKLNIEDK